MVMASAPSPQQVGREFVRQYYTMLHEAPNMLHRFYSSGSTFIHGGVDRPGHVEEPLVGQVEINKKIQQLSFKDCHTKIRQVDSQATISNAVVVQVTGELSNNGEPMRRFMQTFVLVPQTPKKYYVHNDIFRYQDEVYNDNSDVESEDQPSGETSNTVEYYQTQVNQTPVEAVVDYVSPTVPQQQQEALPQRERQPQQETQLNGHQQPEPQQQQQVNGLNDVEVVETSVKTVETKAVEEEKQEVQSVQHEQVQATPAPPQQQAPQQPAQPSSWAKLLANTASSTAPASSVAPTRPVNSTNVTTQPQQQQPVVQQQQQAPAPQQQQSAGKPSQKENRGEKPRQNSEGQFQSGSYNGRQNGNGGGPRSNGTNSTRASVQREQRQSTSNSQINNTNSITEQTPGGSDENAKFARHPDAHQVFVGNLHSDVNEAELQAFFSKYGTVVDVRINKNTKQQVDRKLPNYGFIVFDSKESVDNLLNNGKSSLLYTDSKGTEHRLNIEEKRAKQGSGGGGKQQQRGNRSSSNGSKGGRVGGSGGAPGGGGGGNKRISTTNSVNQNSLRNKP